MEENKIKIAITHGDTNGTGYETIFKTFADPAMLELCTPIIYGSPKIASYHRKTLNMQANFTIINKAEDANADKLNMLTSFDEEVKVELGVPTPVSSAAAQKALQRALKDWENGLFDALVTAPMACNNDANTATANFIAQATNNDGKGLTIHVNDGLRIASLTGDIPLAEALHNISKELIVEKATVMFESLQRDFRLSNPRIAMLQINPKAGTEEEEILKPAIEELQNAGVKIYGPYPADELFSNYGHTNFDGILAMYHSQAMMPMRMLADEGRLTLSAGLPIVHTAPGHDPKFEIAGKGVADESALRSAIYLAIDTCRHRIEHDEPLANPLKKLYHEKRDDSEKVRFAIPKKHEQNQ